MRSRRYRARFGTSVPLNPMALAGNWSALATDIEPSHTARSQEGRHHGRSAPYGRSRGAGQSGQAGQSGGRSAPRSGRPNTTRKPVRRPQPRRADASSATTPEELRVRVRALLAPRSSTDAVAPTAASRPEPAEPVCPQCGGAGRVLVWVGPEDWRMRDVACACAASRLAARALAASDMTTRLRALDFAGYVVGENRLALDAARTWAMDGAAAHPCVCSCSSPPAAVSAVPPCASRVTCASIATRRAAMCWPTPCRRALTP